MTTTDDKIQEYQHAVKTCVLAAKILGSLPLEQLLRDIARADSIGPMLDPTLWRANHQAMDEDRQIIEAAMPLWRLAKKLDPLNHDRPPDRP